MFARCRHNGCFRDCFYTLSEYGNDGINTEANSEYFTTVLRTADPLLRIAVRFFYHRSADASSIKMSIFRRVGIPCFGKNIEHTKYRQNYSEELLTTAHVGTIMFSKLAVPNHSARLK